MALLNWQRGHPQHKSDDAVLGDIMISLDQAGQRYAADGYLSGIELFDAERMGLESVRT